MPKPNPATPGFDRNGLQAGCIVMEPLVIVPARKNSKRLPGKNRRMLGGHSLLEWTLAAARSAGLNNAPLLSTDDEELAHLGKQLGFRVPFMRPGELAQDTTSSVDVALHALDETLDAAPLVMLLQLTSPFRNPALLRQGLDRIADSPVVEAVISVKPLHVSLRDIYTRHDERLQPFSSLATPAFVPTGAMYVVRTEALRQHHSFVPPRTAGVEHSGLETIDIDTEEDWSMAEMAAASGRVAIPSKRN